MADDENFKGNNYGILFSHGISDNKESSRKKVGRRSYCKAKKVAISAPMMGNRDDGEENNESAPMMGNHDDGEENNEVLSNM
ncbi:hypothetical protein Tco_0043447 [Tanacetum coccineum]